MPRKRTKSDKDEGKDPMQEMGDEELEIEGELGADELESLEEEFEEEGVMEDLDEDQLNEIAAAEETLEEEAEAEMNKRRHPPARIGRDDGIDSYEADEYEEEEDVPEVPARRETRQEMLGRLMTQLLAGREQVHVSLERVRDLNTQMRDAGPRPAEKLKEAYHKAITDLSRARRQENFARAELMQVLSWRG